MTTVYLCLPMFTPVYLCSPLFTRVYLCLLMFTYDYSCLLLFTRVYICFMLTLSSLPMFTHVYLCLPMFTDVFSCLPLFTYVYSSFMYVYPCLLVFTTFNTWAPFPLRWSVLFALQKFRISIWKSFESRIVKRNRNGVGLTVPNHHYFIPSTIHIHVAFLCRVGLVSKRSRGD